MVDKAAPIFVAGHRGLVGSAVVRALQARGYSNIVVRTRSELDLTDAVATSAFFQSVRPQAVFMCAAKVGGILANATLPAEFIRENLAIQTNVIHEAWRASVERLLFMGSSCIYPRDAPQPLKESYLLTGPLEATNRPYALAKIAGVEMCWSYNRQYGTRYLATMPTNLYGPNDNYDLESSHVLAALIRKMHDARTSGAPSVELWGTGSPKREFLYCDDLADGCLHLLELDDALFEPLVAPEALPLVNIGVGEDISIRELAEMVAKTVGFKGEIAWDSSKPDGTPRKLLDVSAMAALGWQAGTSLADGITKTYKLYADSL